MALREVLKYTHFQTGGRWQLCVGHSRSAGADSSAEQKRHGAQPNLAKMGPEGSEMAGIHGLVSVNLSYKNGETPFELQPAPVRFIGNMDTIRYP